MPNQALEPILGPRDEANGPIAKQVDSFTPAHSAFGFPIYVARPFPQAPFSVLAATPCSGLSLSR